MVKIENHLGKIEISNEYLAKLAGNTAQSCFGVAGMKEIGATQGIRNLFSKKTYPSKGIRVTGDKNSLTFEIHIVVSYGVNISAIVQSIIHKVKYVVEEETGLTVKKVNVFVDGMKS
jgi:uncharacterized alkaline shock family protein YloU